MSATYKMDISKFCGCFSSFEEFFNKVNLSKYVVRAFPTYGDDELDSDTIYKTIIGSFPYKDELILIVTDAEGSATREEFNKRSSELGVEFIKFSDLIGEEGCCICPSDQFEDVVTEVKEVKLKKEV